VSNDFFRFNQQGKLKNNPENIFNYDSSLYDLYFDSAQKTLYIINIVPPDQEAAKTENQKAIEHIVNVDGYLKYPISKMSDEKKRFAYDSLSGVFLTNVFTSLLHQDNGTLLSQISQAPLYEIWLNANYGGLEFSKLNQTLGAISAQMFDINIGGDLFSNSLLRAGIFAGISKKNFNQSNNRAVLTEKNVGIYSGIFLNRFNAMLLASAAQGEGESEREIKLDKTYNPQGEISLMQFNGALKLGYDFLINRAKNLRQNAGTFVLYEFNQVDIKQIKETDGGIVGLSFPAQTLQKHTAKFGFEFKQESSQMDFFINVFAGQDLEDKQKFELKFIGNEESFKIESDYENLIFYGGQFGINFHLTKAITLGTQFNIALNENLKNYNAGINMKYEFPKDLFKKHRNNAKTASFRVPKLKFVKNSRNLTKESELELDNFIKILKQRAPHYKQVVILVKVDDARNEVSINTNKLTMSRANSVLKILTRNKVLRRKVILSSEKEGMRDAVELRIDFYRARKI
ncbi:MAG: autotransporter outer membrane beta-barrel domain-containing protein, partial [Elusimicrobiota bacterium]|nr:autotransporter outer membrane beta-barrel domain-containing protein [Elusimicrobiota bacterium]